MLSSAGPATLLERERELSELGDALTGALLALLTSGRMRVGAAAAMDSTSGGRRESRAAYQTTSVPYAASRESALTSASRSVVACATRSRSNGSR